MSLISETSRKISSMPESTKRMVNGNGTRPKSRSVSSGAMGPYRRRTPCSSTSSSSSECSVCCHRSMASPRHSISSSRTSSDLTVNNLATVDASIADIWAVRTLQTRPDTPIAVDITMGCISQMGVVNEALEHEVETRLHDLEDEIC